MIDKAVRAFGVKQIYVHSGDGFNIEGVLCKRQTLKLNSGRSYVLSAPLY